MIRWLRVVWPPGWALAWALFLYLGFEGFFLFMEWSLDIPFYSFPEVGRLPTGMMGIMVALYAIYRIWGFHPHARPPYSQWLATTVWNAEKALPLGPVHLVWQDALLIVIAAGLCWPRAQASALLVPLAFAAAYVVSLAVVNTSVGEKHWSYVIAFWFGIMALAWGNVPIFAATIVVGYGLAYCGLRRSLRRFPWDGQPNIFSPAYQDAKKNKLVGWPYDHLGPKFSDDIPIGRSDTVIVGGLAGWWIFVISALFRHAHAYTAQGALIICLSLVLFGCAGRLIRYCMNYYPPIDFAARPLPWVVIPGYDQVLAAPAMALAVYLLIGTTPDWLPIDALFAPPLAVMAASWILMGMGPNLKEWRLTGNHRIVPGIQTAGETR